MLSRCIVRLQNVIRLNLKFYEDQAVPKVNVLLCIRAIPFGEFQGGEAIRAFLPSLLLQEFMCFKLCSRLDGQF